MNRRLLLVNFAFYLNLHAQICEQSSVPKVDLTFESSVGTNLPIGGNSPEEHLLFYLAQRYAELENDYRNVCGNYSQSCSVVAYDVATQMIKLKKSPEIYLFQENSQLSDVANQALRPLRYGGRVTWFAHFVAVLDGVVYDPLIGRPVPLENYGHEAFGYSVEYRLAHDKDYVAACIREQNK
jgi:hypothetical protein